MSESAKKYEIPQVSGVGDMIPYEHKKQVLAEIERLVKSEGNRMCEIARIFDASPEIIQEVIRTRLKGTRYETY